MPRERRRCNLQGGVSLALLRKQAAAFARLCLREDQSIGTMGLLGAGNRNLFQPCAGISAFAGIDFGARATASSATICPPQFSAMGAAGAARAVCENARIGKTGSGAVGRHLQQIFLSGDEARRPPSFGATPLHGEGSPRSFVLRAAFV